MKLNIVIISIISVVGGFYLATIREGHGWGGDFSLYIHHAKNIAEGIDYKDTGYIYNPSYPSLSPKTYPPIFPLLLSPVYKCFGLNLTVMKVEVILFFLMSLFILYLVFKADLPPPYLIVIVAVIGFSPYFWGFKDNVLSDIPFLFFTYLSIFLVNRAYQSDHLRRTQTLYFIPVGISIYLAYGTRAIGAVLIPSLLAYDMVKLKRPSQFAIKVTLLFVFLMILQNVFLHSEGSYFDQLRISREVISSNLHSYKDSLSVILENGFSTAFSDVLFIIVSVSAIIGYVARVKDGITIFEIFVVLYTAIVIVWPANQGTRFLIAVIPLYFFYAFSGVRRISFFRRKWLERAVLTALVLVIFISYVTQYAKMDYGPIREGVAKKETVELFSYIKQTTQEKDIFIFRKPRVLSLFTGRRASVYHQPQNDKELWDYFHEIKVTYVIVTQAFSSDQTFLLRFIEKYKDNFREVYSNSDFEVYELVRLPRFYERA